MSYQEKFNLVDDLLVHLDSIVEGEPNPFISSRYVGFLAVAAVTVYELAIKDIYISFAHARHEEFGGYIRMSYAKLNGQIRISHLKDVHLSRFGSIYVERFREILDNKERATLRSERISISSAYGNIITWRHQFAHEGQIPNLPTYREVRESYKAGKHVIHCLAESLNSS